MTDTTPSPPAAPPARKPASRSTGRTTGRSFVLGALAGALLLGTGLALGGAQRSQRGHHNDRPDAEFDALTVQRLDVTDRRGKVRLRLRGNAEDGGNIRVFDEHGDLRVQLRADGSVITYGGNERVRARLGRDPDGYGSRRGGVLELYDERGRLTSKLPGRGGNGHSHDHDDECEIDYDDRRPHYSDHDRPSRPWWREDE